MRDGTHAWAAIALGALLTATIAGDAHAAGAPYFQGKTITILYGGGETGGYVTYARLLALHYGRFIPGEPRFIVKGAPGAGTLVAANQLYELSRPDGTEIGTVGGGTATAELFKTPNIRFDPRKFVWIGSLTSDVSLGISWHTSPVKTVADARKRQMIVGGGGPTSGNVLFPVVMNRLLGTKFKIITGYKSSAEVMLAVERGELEGVMSWNYSSVRASHMDLIRDHKVNLMVQFALKKHRELPDVPLITDFATNDEERAILDLVFSRQEMGRPFMAPPKTPRSVAKILRDAFAALIKDPTFLADAERQHLDINQPMTGAEIDKLIAGLYATPKAVVEKAVAITDMTTFK
ncbi:MAG TPA: tripartite tricarboxylate transporter substrate-binding protein [Alphaproteobacteria bacterium]|nr:tripartite tricarboxylate transporter substrate-binding protein [Alphaproteobacteria bacterium]